MLVIMSSLLSSGWALNPNIQTLEYTMPINQVESIGVLQFRLADTTRGQTDIDVLQASLEERTRQEMLPLLQQHTNIQLITPENLNISGNLPVGGRILDTSKALGLTYVVTGTILLDNDAEIILKLYHVDTGVLLQQKSVRAESPMHLNYVPTRKTICCCHC